MSEKKLLESQPRVNNARGLIGDTDGEMFWNKFKRSLQYVVLSLFLIHLLKGLTRVTYTLVSLIRLITLILVTLSYPSLALKTLERISTRTRTQILDVCTPRVR